MNFKRLYLSIIELADRLGSLLFASCCLATSYARSALCALSAYCLPLTHVRTRRAVCPTAYCLLLTAYCLPSSGVVLAQEPFQAPALVWKVKLKGPILSPPAVHEGMLYIPMSNQKLYRMDVRNGRYEDISKVNGVASLTPQVYAGRLFFMLDGQPKKDRRMLAAFDLKKKKTLWQKPLLNTWSTPLLHETTLYTGAEDGYVYAMDIETGDTRWRFQTKRRIRSSPVISDSLLFIGSDDNHLYALHTETGRLVWSFETGGSILAAPAVADDAVYTVSYDQNLYCLDQHTGKLRWTFKANGSLYAAPVVSSYRILLGSNDRNLYCLDARTGRLFWRYETDGIIRATPVLHEDVVYMVSSDRHVYAVDIVTGRVLWQYETEGSITVSPVIVDHTLLVGSEDRHIYAFRKSGM